MSEVPKIRSAELPEAPFGRVVTAMATPFTEDLSEINYGEAVDLGLRLGMDGSHALAIAGTTGESPTITHAEQRQLFREMRGGVPLPLLAGVGSNSTKEAVELTEYVTENHLADGLLVVSPYYNRPPQSGIYDYYAAIARATDLPIVMYNIPVRTGRPIKSETMLCLAEKFDNIRGLKDATGEPDKTIAFMRDPNLPDDFYVYSGDDALNLELARFGSVGAISVASHWAGKEIGDMYAALEAGDEATAAAINQRLQPSYEFETSEDTPNPIPTKAMLRAIGYRAVGYGRSPMVLGSHQDESNLERAARLVYNDLKSTQP